MRFDRIDSVDTERRFFNMAILIRCVVCEQAVASDAEGSCPGCKTPDPTGRKAKKKRLERLLALGVVVAMGAWLVWGFPQNSASDPIGSALYQKFQALLSNIR